MILNITGPYVLKYIKPVNTNMCGDLDLQATVSGKRILKKSKHALHLVLEPPSMSVKKPHLGGHPCVHVDTRNCVLGSVNGNTCSVQLDSGANITFLFWNMAKKLRLITGQEATATQEIDLWLGPKELEVVQLESVTIELGDGVVVVTPATVFPEWLEPHYDAEDVVLDAHQLRRGKMVQVFRPDGSDLIVRKPDQLLRRVCKSQRSMEPDVLKVKLLRRGKSKVMTLLMDTGAVGIHVSNKRSRLLTKAHKTRWLPKRVVLHIGDGCCLHAEPLEEVASNDDDFISGIGLLGKYNAVLDYAHHTVTFQVGSQWRKVAMQTRHQALSTESEQR